MNKIYLYSSLSLCLFLGACNNVPQEQPREPLKPAPAKNPVTHEPNVSSGVKITPYQQAAISRKNLLSVTNPKNTNNNPQVFQQLMQSTTAAYNAKRWSEAERFALQAQRISPQAAETYLYLSLIAQQKAQYSNSQSLARRGLSYAYSNSMQKQLWLVILQTAQIQNDQATVKQAQLALKSL